MRSIAKFLGQAVVIVASAVTALSAWAAVPVKPTGTSPGSTTSPGTVQASSSVTLSWGAASGATRYGLGVVDVATGGLVVNTDVSGKTTYTAGLQPGKSYRWNVNACNASGCSAYTSLLYFQTPVPAKTLSSVAVLCPATVNEGATASCTAKATFSDNSTQDVTTNAANWSENSAYATIGTTTGVLAAAAVTANQTVTVTASYAYNGGLPKSGTFSVTIKDVPTYGLTVTKAGTGSGTVSGSGLSCSGSTCNGTYNSDASAVLTAAATGTSTFGGWSGCTSISGTTCTVRMTGTKSVTATFTTPAPDFTLTVTAVGTGNGTVSGSGLICSGSTCKGSYAFGKSVTLTANAAAGSVFKGWSDAACPGVGVCTLTLAPPRVANVSITATFAVSTAYNGNWPVPYLRQTDYANIRESACGPTSVAMLLRHFYPRASIDMPEIYHSGTQDYSYAGAAIGYKNISVAKGKTGTDPGLSSVDKMYWPNYSNANSTGMVIDNIKKYLSRTWGIQTSSLDENGVYAQIKNGPLLGHVYGHGNPNWGHFVVIRGIDDHGTPNDRTDDVIYINDPYDSWSSAWDTGGQNKAIPYAKFFHGASDCNGLAACSGAWFRDALSFTLPETEDLRQGVVVVDTGHNGIEGDVSSHRLDLDDTSKWTLTVGGGGDWYTPNAGETNRAARWTPRILVEGYYEVTVRYLASSANSASVQYTIYTPPVVGAPASLVAGAAINQYTLGSNWSVSTIASRVYLRAGSYIRVSGVAAGTNIDAIKLKLIPQ